MPLRLPRDHFKTLVSRAAPALAAVALVLLAGGCSFAAVPVHEVPLEISAYHLPFINVVVAGRECRAIIDTGSFREVEVSSTLARELKLELETTTTKARRYGDKEFFLQKGRIPSLRIGEWRAADVAIDVAEGDLESIAAQVGTKFDVVLGWGFWMKFHLQVDYPGRKLRWSSEPFTVKPEVAFSFAVVNRVPLVKGKLEDREVTLLFDTGAPMCNLDPEFAAGAAAGAKKKAKLRLGEREFEPEFRVKKLGAAGRAPPWAAVVGNNLLADYLVTFDPKRSEIALSR